MHHSDISGAQLPPDIMVDWTNWLDQGAVLLIDATIKCQSLNCLPNSLFFIISEIRKIYQCLVTYGYFFCIDKEGTNNNANIPDNCMLYSFILYYRGNRE